MGGPRQRSEIGPRVSATHSTSASRRSANLQQNNAFKAASLKQFGAARSDHAIPVQVPIVTKEPTGRRLYRIPAKRLKNKFELTVPTRDAILVGAGETAEITAPMVIQLSPTDLVHITLTTPFNKTYKLISPRFTRIFDPSIPFTNPLPHDSLLINPRSFFMSITIIPNGKYDYRYAIALSNSSKNK
jgi:hypothetical protein